MELKRAHEYNTTEKYYFTAPIDIGKISDNYFKKDKSLLHSFIENPKILLRALNYASSLDSLFIGHCEDYYFSKGVSATSSAFATKMGLSSTPKEAELMGLARDFLLADLSEVNYHAAQITTKKSFLRIKELKSLGKKITAGTSIHHLLFD